ncbi:hypothetical protein VPAG_00071 [Vibrio phage douglas 12A4]|uniref:hypothetical protein n=1 Tax=Vibrio phage douglas 12A4 TaxID=573171 RepID=UPI0002C0C0A3|nr:hypothetical protein VPAG_00071 [Vibrio phage douglas 12A4]AGG58107.1 hypothetical protein VPAG_00071 [Vibrio phage douglas 12A4]
MKYLIISFLLISGCTINLQIDTDYAAQRNMDGTILETIDTETTSSITPTTDLEVDSGAL